MKNGALIAALLSVASLLLAAAPAPYPITVNSRAAFAPPLEVYRGNRTVIRASFVDGTTASSIATNETPFMSWATSNTASSVVTAQYATVAGTTGVIDFTFSQTDLNYTPGRYVYEIGVRDTNSAPSVYRQGVFVITGSPTGVGVDPTSFSSNINWALYDYTGTQTDGPVRADAATIIPTTNADGSITLNVSTNLSVTSITLGSGTNTTVITWNADEDTQGVDLTHPDGGTVTVNQETYRMWKNADVVAITNGQPVALAGGSGRIGRIVLAQAGDHTRDEPIGVYTGEADLPVDGIGRVTRFGAVKGIDLDNLVDGTWAESSDLFVSTNRGRYVTNSIVPPIDKFRVGVVTYASPAAQDDISVEMSGHKHWDTLDGRYVNADGDTMTGDLTISKTNPSLIFNEGANTFRFDLEDGGTTFRLNTLGFDRYYWDFNYFRGLGSGQFAINANVGSNARPSYAFADALDMGMYKAGANALGFSTASTNRLLIGNTGITSTVPLTVNGLLTAEDCNIPAGGKLSFGSLGSIGDDDIGYPSIKDADLEHVLGWDAGARRLYDEDGTLVLDFAASALLDDGDAGMWQVEGTATGGNQIVNFSTLASVTVTSIVMVADGSVAITNGTAYINIAASSSGGGATGLTYRIFADAQANTFTNQPDLYQKVHAAKSTTHTMAGFDKDGTELLGADMVYLPANFSSNILVQFDYYTSGSTNTTFGPIFWYATDSAAYTFTNAPTIIPESDLTNQASCAWSLTLTNAVAGDKIWWSVGIAGTNDAVTSRNGTIFVEGAQCEFMVQ